MEDERQSAALFAAGGGQKHRWAAWHNHGRAAGASYELAIGSLQAGLSGEVVPGFGARVGVNR